MLNRKIARKNMANAFFRGSGFLDILVTKKSWKATKKAACLRSFALFIGIILKLAAKTIKSHIVFQTITATPFIGQYASEPTPEPDRPRITRRIAFTAFGNCVFY
jgi:hypothetical protein